MFMPPWCVVAPLCVVYRIGAVGFRLGPMPVTAWVRAQLHNPPMIGSVVLALVVMAMLFATVLVFAALGLLIGVISYGTERARRKREPRPVQEMPSFIDLV